MSDALVKFKKFDTIDNLAYEYYKDATLGWVIMCANPDFNFEFEVPEGAIIRIPLPLDRVWRGWGETLEI